LGGCARRDNRTQDEWLKELDSPPPKEAQFPDQVSLIRLIANPRDYADRYIRVFGYLHLEFERDALFIRKEDCAQWLEPNSIQIGISRNEIRKKMLSLNDSYVMLEGKFYFKHGDWNGSIWNISRVEKWPLDINFVKLEVQKDGKEKEPNQALEPTSTAVTPPANAGDRASGTRGSP